MIARQASVGQVLVLDQPRAVVAREEHDGVVGQTVRFQGPQQATDAPVDLLNHVAVEPALFREIPDEPTTVVVDRDAVEQDAALVGHDDAHDHADGRRLAGAVGPQQTEDRAPRHLEAQVVHRRHIAVAFADVADFQDRVAHVPPCGPVNDTRFPRGGSIKPVRVRVLDRCSASIGVLEPRPSGPPPATQRRTIGVVARR